MEDYDEVYSFWQDNTYPNGLSKNEKRNFRRKCNENFFVREGQLYHRKSTRDDRKLRPTVVEASGRLCIKTAEEKLRILKACHSSEIGTYFCM